MPKFKVNSLQKKKTCWLIKHLEFISTKWSNRHFEYTPYQLPCPKETHAYFSMRLCKKRCSKRDLPIFSTFSGKNLCIFLNNLYRKLKTCMLICTPLFQLVISCFYKVWNFSGSKFCRTCSQPTRSDYLPLKASFLPLWTFLNSGMFNRTLWNNFVACVYRSANS
jgi:hypothetical protein